MTTVREFGARGDGKTDDTAALSHAIQRGGGELLFPRGDYVISRPLYVPLQLHGRIALAGAGGTARLLMNGPGPALHLVGTHARTAEPSHFAEGVWQRERLPTVRDLEIVGGHARADGIRVEGAMQPTLRGLLIRRCRHGIHLANRDRNVLIANCHVYDNRGVGVFFDRVNLHQTNITGSHISYCKQGGIKIVGSEIRNLQICGNDIEYNHDLKAESSADVLFDCRAGTVREGTLVGNTIQAVQSPGGANVRFLGAGQDNPNAVGLFAITGNLIGSQHTALHLVACRGVAVSGNSIYSGYQYALRAEDCEHLVIGPNSIDHNPEYRGRSTDQMIFRRCRNVTLTGLVLQHTREALGEVEASVEVRECQNVSLTGCQILGARGRGVAVRGSSVVRVADCTVRGRAGDKAYRAAVTVDKGCTRVMVVHNFLGRGSDGELQLPKGSGVANGNVTL
jgi:parallel beta-helix repeat protein